MVLYPHYTSRLFILLTLPLPPTFINPSFIGPLCFKHVTLTDQCLHDGHKFNVGEKEGTELLVFENGDFKEENEWRLKERQMKSRRWRKKTREQRRAKDTK